MLNLELDTMYECGNLDEAFTASKEGLELCHSLQVRLRRGFFSEKKREVGWVVLERWPRETFQDWGWIMVVDGFFSTKKNRDKKHLHFKLQRFKGVAKFMGFDLFQIKVCSCWSHPSAAGDGEFFSSSFPGAELVEMNPWRSRAQPWSYEPTAGPAGRMALFDVHFDVDVDVGPMERLD